jgi:periplasmic protein TonB
MPTCFLKRVLPFALALVVGLMLVKFLGISGWRANRVVMPQQSSFADGNEVSNESRVFKPREVDQKAQIISRAEPQYTEEARENAVEGTVVLRAVFSADGQVTNIRVIGELPYGLTEKAVEAARRIRFAPAVKDGRAVSQYIQIEYNFNLY